MEKLQSLQSIRQSITLKEFTLPELLTQYFQVIEKHKHLNAFNEVFFDSATDQAIKVQEKILNGTAGKLAGMVIGIKDNISYKNHQVSASSKMLENYVSPYSATAIEKLLQEDAVIIGRLNCDEFAMGGSNETSAMGPVRNFINPALVPGGSSGGSAVAVQANMCLASLGTDTGGSVRQPAAYCGIIGLKPSYGRISRYGVIAYASSFDQIGVFTHSIEDAAELLEVLAGADQKDSTVSTLPVPSYSKKLERPNGQKIAVLKETMVSNALDPEIKIAINNCIDELKLQGHKIIEIDFDLLDYLVPTYYILTAAEASSNLSRYDGVRYGHRNLTALNLNSLYKFTRSEGFGEEVKRRILLGTFVLSAGYYDAYYQKAQKVRRLIKEKLDQILSVADFILLPVTPTPPYKIGEHEQDPLAMYMGDIYTVLASLAGLPAIALPIGNNSNNLPLSVQLIGGKFKEAELLAFSKCITDKLK